MSPALLILLAVEVPEMFQIRTIHYKIIPVKDLS